MAILGQNQSAFAQYVIWFGNCGNSAEDTFDLTSSDKIDVTKQKDTQFDSLNNSSSVSKHSRRVSFGGPHSSDSSRSNNVNIISGVLKPSVTLKFIL